MEDNLVRSSTIYTDSYEAAYKESGKRRLLDKYWAELVGLIMQDLKQLDQRSLYLKPTNMGFYAHVIQLDE